MGNIEGKDNRKGVQGGIYIQLHKTNFISNELIEGQLHINLEEKFQGHLLVLQLDGVEETRFDYQVVSKNKKKENKKAKGIKKFLSVNMPIYDFSNLDAKLDRFFLEPGQWTIPFQMKIAEKLPSSVRHFKSITHNCSIQYSLSAYILPTDFNCRPIQGEQIIFISQQHPNQKDIVSRFIENSPLFSCCLSAGSYSLTCTLAQNSFAPTEIIGIQVECDQKKLKKKIKKVRIELVENITMNTNTGLVQNKERFVVSKTDVVIDDFLVQTSIAVPSTIACSVQGTIIEISYVLIISPLLDLSCIKANDPLIIPIKITTPKQMENSTSFELPQLNQVETPQNWNPKILKQKEYNQEMSLKVQQLYLEFQEKQNKILFNNLTSQIEKFEMPMMQNPAVQK